MRLFGENGSWTEGKDEVRFGGFLQQIILCVGLSRGGTHRPSGSRLISHLWLLLLLLLWRKGKLESF